MTVCKTRPPRSLLFVPVLNEKLVAKACGVAADAVVLDLEASIPANLKEQARQRLAHCIHTLHQAGRKVLVRVNRDNTQDCIAAVEHGADAIVVPCVENAGHIRVALDSVQQLGSAAPVAWMPIIETPLGLLNVKTIVAMDVNFAGILFGAEDFVLRVGQGVKPSEAALFNAAWQVSVTASAYDLPCYGIAGSIAAFRDPESFRRLCHQAKSIGMVGCPAIHPDQIRIVNEVFQPTNAEVEAAQAVVTAFEAANFSAVSHQGEMIDYPIYDRAKNLLLQFCDEA